MSAVHEACAASSQGKSGPRGTREAAIANWAITHGLLRIRQATLAWQSVPGQLTATTEADVAVAEAAAYTAGIEAWNGMEGCGLTAAQAKGAASSLPRTIPTREAISQTCRELPQPCA